MSLALAILLLALLAGSTQAAPGPTPKISELNRLATQIDRAKDRRCLGPARFRWHPAHKVPAWIRTYVIGQRRHRLAAVQARRPAHPACPASYYWSRTEAAECVSRNEGGLRSNTGNGYYGRWQADLDFQRTYGREFFYRLGTANNWARWQQDVMAWRGWRARGWQPWPSTSVECGLR